MVKGKKREAAAAAADEGTGFEGSLARLEEIVGELEGGDLPLERALALFEEGTRLGRLCSRRLDEAERKITVLLEAVDGSLDETDFTAAAPQQLEAAPRPARQRAPAADDSASDDGLPF